MNTCSLDLDLELLMYTTLTYAPSILVRSSGNCRVLAQSFGGDGETMESAT